MSEVPLYRSLLLGREAEALGTRHTLEPLAWHWNHLLGIGAIGLALEPLAW